jgi:hypothetical protein
MIVTVQIAVVPIRLQRAHCDQREGCGDGIDACVRAAARALSLSLSLSLFFFRRFTFRRFACALPYFALLLRLEPMQGTQNALGRRFAHGQKLSEIPLDLDRMKLLVLAPSSLDTIGLVMR